MVEAAVVRGNPRCDGDTCRTAVEMVVVEPAAEGVAGRDSVVGGRESVPTAVSGSCVWLWNRTRPDRPRRHRSPWPAGQGCVFPSRHRASAPAIASARAAAAFAVGLTVAAVRRLIATSRKRLQRRPLLPSSVRSSQIWRSKKKKKKETVRTMKGKKNNFENLLEIIIIVPI